MTSQKWLAAKAARKAARARDPRVQARRVEAERAAAKAAAQDGEQPGGLARWVANRG